MREIGQQREGLVRREENGMNGGERRCTEEWATVIVSGSWSHGYLRKLHGTREVIRMILEHSIVYRKRSASLEFAVHL